MTTIEKAVAAAYRAYCGAMTIEWESDPEGQLDKCIRAALQAIREVDEETFRAGEMAMPGYNDSGPSEPWLAMIDHILSQGNGK